MTVTWEFEIARDGAEMYGGSGETEEVEAFLCQECGEVSAETNEGPLYECGGCGEKFTRDNSNNGANQCPQCYKMAAKLTDGPLCSACDGEVEEITAQSCCGEIYGDDRDEDLATHIRDEHFTI